MLHLRQLAEDKNLSQGRLGQIMGVSQSAVSQMMGGFQKIKYEHYEALVNFFGKETIDAYLIPDGCRHLPSMETSATILSKEAVEDIQSVPIDIYIEDMRMKDAEIYALNAEIRRQNERMDKLVEKLLER